MATNNPERREEEETGGTVAGEDEDTGAQIAPIVRLEEVAVTTGEEDEDVLLDLKAKLYRFDKEGNQWKERGTGNVKILKHKDTGKVRLVMRQVKTLKICANHLILPSIKLQEHAGSEKSCVWHAPDFSDGELKDETFCIRFGSVDSFSSFSEMRRFYKMQELANILEKAVTVEENTTAESTPLQEEVPEWTLETEIVENKMDNAQVMPHLEDKNEEIIAETAADELLHHLILKTRK